MRKLSHLISAALAMTLAACGGGSGGNPAPPPPPPPAGPTADDITNARNSALGMVFSPATKGLAISWTDAFPGEMGFRVEKLSGASTWEAVESVPASANTGATVSWSGTVAQTSTYRVVVVRDGYVVPLEAAPGVTTGKIELAATTPAIQLNQPLPLRATARFSVVSAGAATSVRYLIDGTVLPGTIVGQVLGPYTNAPDFSSEPLAPGSVGLGSHQVDAFLSVAPGVELRLQRTFDVANPGPNVSWRYLTQVDSAGILTVTVSNGQSDGFATLRIFVDGTEVPLTYENIVYGQWSATVDASGWPRGPVTLRLLGTSYTAQAYDESWSVMIDRTPQLALESPANGAIVQGSLQIKGVVTDDSPAVTTTAQLGLTDIFQTPLLAFDQAVSLAGTAAGEYSLQVNSRDSEYNVAVANRTIYVVAADSPFTFHHIIDGLPNTAELLDSDGTTLLYRGPSSPGAVTRVIRRSAAGDETVLEGSETFVAQSNVDPRVVDPVWNLSGNRVAVAANFAVLQAVTYDAAGAAQLLPYVFSVGETGALRAGLQGNWLIWGAERAYLRNLATAGPDLGPIAIGSPGLRRGFAFAAQPGAERLFYSKSVSSSQYEMHFFDVTNETTTQFTSSGGRNLRPQTDGVRVAWEQMPTINDIAPYVLLAAPVANPTPGSTVQFSAQMLQFRLADGTLAWTEPFQNRRVLKVDDASGTVVASDGFEIEIHGTSAGHVLFSEAGKLYVWSRADGKRLLLPGIPHAATINNGVVFLVTGFNDGQSIYRVDL